MSKFFLVGPISFLPKNSALNGLMSLPFLSLCILNLMFGVRSICLESAFFTSYISRYTHHVPIEPLISPEYRLAAYFFPCLLSFSFNAARLAATCKGLGEYVMKYPQFLLAPCFTPFMFEGYEGATPDNPYKIRIWRRGTLFNAFYIGCLPQCILLAMEYYRGVPSWTGWLSGVSQGVNDSLFPSQNGNTLFAIISFLISFTIIAFFFCSDILFKDQGVYCKCFHILFFPCPNNCIHYSEHESDSVLAEEIPGIESSTNTRPPIKDYSKQNKQTLELHTEIYHYKKGRKTWTMERPILTEEKIFQVRIKRLAILFNQSYMLFI